MMSGVDAEEVLRGGMTGVSFVLPVMAELDKKLAKVDLKVDRVIGFTEDDSGKSLTRDWIASSVERLIKDASVATESDSCRMRLLDRM